MSLRVLITADAVGGVWQYATDLAAALPEHGIEPVIAMLGPAPRDDQRRALGDGVEFVETGLALDWTAASADELLRAGDSVARLARRLGADLVQLNTPALAAGVAFDRPTIAVAHSCVATWWEAVKGGALPSDLEWRAALHGQGLACADRVVAPSAAFAEATRRVYALPSAPMVVHNGRRQMAAAESAQIDWAFTAGRLWDAGKNVATLDRAAARLPFPLHAAGPCAGPTGDRIALDHAQALGTLSEAELAERLAVRPVFASAALYEPFGLAVLEAAVAGCALVLSDIPTLRELWSGVAAFVDPLDADGFAEAIALVVADDFARAEMGRRARDRAATYSVEAMAAAMTALYHDLIQEQAAAPRPSMVAA